MTSPPANKVRGNGDRPAKKTPSQQAWFTPSEVAKKYRIKPERVIVMIRAGLIRAIDVSSPGSLRPRFRIHTTDLIAFEVSREVKPVPIRSTRKRRPKSDVIEFF